MDSKSTLERDEGVKGGRDTTGEGWDSANPELNRRRSERGRRQVFTSSLSLEIYARGTGTWYIEHDMTNLVICCILNPFYVPLCAFGSRCTPSNSQRGNICTFSVVIINRDINSLFPVIPKYYSLRTNDNYMPVRDTSL